MLRKIEKGHAYVIDGPPPRLLARVVQTSQSGAVFLVEDANKNKFLIRRESFIRRANNHETTWLKPT